MAFALYAGTAALLLLLAHRFVAPIRWRWRIILAALPILFTGRALLTGRVYAPVDLPYNVAPLAGLKAQYGVGDPHNIMLGDLYTEIVPWREAVRSEIAAGRWPVWNRHVLSGTLLAGAAQPAAYSPFTLIALLLPAVTSFSFSASITFLLAGLGAFLFARELGCRDLVAGIAVAGWMFSTGIAFFVLWPLGASWALLPSVLLAVRRVALAPSVASAALFTTILSLLVLQGHPETTFHVCAIGGAYFLASASGGWRRLARACTAAAGASIAAALICAVYLLPVLEAIPQTREHEHRIKVWSVYPRGIPIQRGLARVATGIFPFLHSRKWAHAGQVSLETIAVGGILIAAALYGVARTRRRETMFFSLVFLFCLAAHMEQASFERVLQHLPLFDVAINSRLAFGAAFCLVILAALGLEHYASTSRPAGFAAATSLVLIALAAGSWWLARAGVVVGPSFPWARWRLAGDLVPLAVACAVLWMPIPRRHTLATLFVLVVAARWICDGRIYPAIESRAAYPHIPLLDAIDRKGQPFRITGVGQAFPPGTSTFYDLEDVRGYEPMLLTEYLRTYQLWCAEQPVWFNRIDDLKRPFLSFLNVRYAIGSEMTAPEGWREVARDHGAVLLENLRVVPRVFVPASVRLGTVPDQAVYEMHSQPDFATRAWIGADVHAHDRSNGPGSVAFEHAGNEYRIDATMQNDGWVVISEQNWKGWRAYIDERPVGVQTANVAFISVFVPAGTHRLRVVYRPASVVAGRAISALSLLALAATAVLSVRARRSGPV